MPGDERQKPDDLKKRAAHRAVNAGKLFIAHTLRASDRMDRLCIKAWAEYLRAEGHEDLAKAAEVCNVMIVRKRWPVPGVPLPRIPIDFKQRAVGEA